MKNTCICIGSMLGGIAIGTALTLFLTPKTGAEMREVVRDCFAKEAEKIRCHCRDNQNE